MRCMQNKFFKSKKGLLFLILGTLAVFVGTGVFAIVTALCTGWGVEAVFGGTNTYVLLTAAMPCIIVCFVLLELMLLMQYLPATEAADASGKAAPTDRSFTSFVCKKKTVRLITLGIVGLIVVCGAVSANTYTVVSDEGVSTRCFLTLSSYKWEDLTSYAVDFDEAQGLSVICTMKGNKKFELIQNAISATNKFKGNYGDGSQYARAAELLTDTWSQMPLVDNRTPTTLDREAIEQYYKDSPYLDSIKILIQSP